MSDDPVLSGAIKEKMICLLWDQGFNTAEIANMLKSVYECSEAQVDDLIFDHYVAAKRKHP